MSRTTDSKKQIILDFINEYYGSYGETPTVRDIAAGTGIAVTSVHRYLSANLRQYTHPVAFSTTLSFLFFLIQTMASCLSTPFL